MREAQSSSLGLPGMAILLGVLGDSLLRATPWGLGVAVWIGLAFAGGWALMPARPAAGSAVSKWPPALLAFFAICLVWRDSPFLKFWDVVAMLGALSLMALQSGGVGLRLGGISKYAAGAVATGINVAFGALLVSPAETPRRASRWFGPQLTSALVGSLIAVPLLIVFGGSLCPRTPGSTTSCDPL